MPSPRLSTDGDDEAGEGDRARKTEHALRRRREGRSHLALVVWIDDDLEGPAGERGRPTVRATMTPM